MKAGPTGFKVVFITVGQFICCFPLMSLGAAESTGSDLFAANSGRVRVVKRLRNLQIWHWDFLSTSEIA